MQVVKFYGVKMRAKYHCFGDFIETTSRRIFTDYNDAEGYMEEFKNKVFSKYVGPFELSPISVEISIIDYEQHIDAPVSDRLDSGPVVSNNIRGYTGPLRPR